MLDFDALKFISEQNAIYQGATVVIIFTLFEQKRM